MDYKKKLLPLTDAERKILKQGINGSIMLFLVIMVGLIMGTLYGRAPFFVPLFLLIVLIGGMALLYSNSAKVQKDLKEGMKEVIVGVIKEKEKRSLNGKEGDIYYVIGPDKVYTDKYNTMVVGDMVEVHRAVHSGFVFELRKLR